MGTFKKQGVWWIDFYVKGVRKRKKIGPSKRIAALALAQVKVKIAKGEYLGIYEDKKRTFRQFAPEYLAYSQAHKSARSFQRDQGIIDAHLLPVFGDHYLSEITLAQAEQYQAQRRQAVDAATVNKELNCLKAMLNKAVAWESLKANSLAGMARLKEPPGRLRYLSLEEKDRLLTALFEPPYLLPVVLMAMHTRMRRGKLVGLSWRDIDVRHRTITLRTNKNNELQVIPLNETALAVLQTLPRHLDTDRAFPGVNGNMVSMAFRRACQRAGVEDLRFHDLRHTFGSYLAMAGLNIRTIQQLLGHKDLRMTQRYAHLSAEHLQQAVHRLDEVMGTSAEGSVQTLVEG
jgi:integrase